MRDELKAIGAVVIAWKTAQGYWCPDKKGIPINVFDEVGIPRELIKVGLADLVGDEVRIRGSEEHFAWYFQCVEAGRAGGQRSASRPRNEKGQLLPNSPSDRRGSLGSEPSDPQANSKRTPSESNPLSLPLSLSLNTKEPSSKGAVAVRHADGPGGPGSVIAAYCEAWKKRYGSRPVIDGKVQGQVKALLKAVSADQAVLLVQAFVQIDDPWFKTKFHDFGTLMQNLGKVSVALEKGVADPQKQDEWDKVFTKGGKGGRADVQDPGRPAGEPVATLVRD